MRHSRVGLARDVHLVSLHGKGVDKVLPEAQELPRHVLLALGGDVALAVAGADGLLDVDDVGQVVVAPGVGHRVRGARRPDDGAVLLEEAVKGRAAGLGER